MAQPFAHPALMGLLRPLVYAHAESMTQPVTLMFDPGSSAIAIKETVIAAAIKSRCVLLTLYLQSVAGGRGFARRTQSYTLHGWDRAILRLFGNLNRSIESIRGARFLSGRCGSFL